MTAAELRARLTHALKLQDEYGFSTPAALAAAWDLPRPEPVAINKVRTRRSSRRRRSRGTVRPHDSAQRAYQVVPRALRERRRDIQLSDR